MYIYIYIFIPILPANSSPSVSYAPVLICKDAHGSWCFAVRQAGRCKATAEITLLGVRRRLHQAFGYGPIPINTIFRGMNIHLPAILMFTRGTRFWHTAIWDWTQKKTMFKMYQPADDLRNRKNVATHWINLDLSNKCKSTRMKLHSYFLLPLPSPGWFTSSLAVAALGHRRHVATASNDYHH